MKSLITTAEWEFGTLWWSASHLYCSWEQACKTFQIVLLLFYVFSSLFNSCNKLSWCKLYVSVGIGIKIHSNVEDEIYIIFFLFYSKLDYTWQYLVWNVAEVGTKTPICRQKPRRSLRVSNHSALSQTNRFPCCLLFVSLLLTSMRNGAKSGGSLFFLF